MSDRTTQVTALTTAKDQSSEGDTDQDEEAADTADTEEELAASPHDRMPRVLPTVMPCPVSWASVFGRRAPLEVELGFGRPHFLLERAAEAPDADHVGIEWKGRWPQSVWDKQARGLHKNVRALHGNAWLLFPSLFASSSVRAVVLNFPDPWWKSKHKKRRILQDTFVNTIADRLVVGGTILIQTDVASLLEEYLARLEACALLENPHGPMRLLPKKPIGASSHREKKCRADGVPIFRAWVRRIV
jgi:tRNA (guanine-N7-)-methyltransferase